MPIDSIVSQPATDSIQAVYRPIVFKVKAFATGSDITAPVMPPIVFCDIYFLTGYPIGTNIGTSIGVAVPTAIYYRTLSKTKAGPNYIFAFDIQDACQEVLSKEMPAFLSGEMFIPRFAHNTVQCKFRSSGVDGSGFTTPEGTAPVQPTDDTNEGDGDGTTSNQFYILNTTLRHEQNQNLADHLNAYKYGTWKNGYYPLSHRPNKYYLSINDNDHFPFFYPKGVILKKIRLLFRYINQTTQWAAEMNIPSVWGDPDTDIPDFTFTASADYGGVMYVPSGPRNLQALFTTLNLIDIAEYSVQILELSGDIHHPGDVVMQTPWHVIQQEQSQERFRIRFLNYLGTFDAINFVLASTTHETKSDQTQKPTSYPLVKSQHSLSRFNVKSNDTWTVKNATYDESKQEWLDELMDSPCAWMEMEGTEGQDPYYLPIVIADQKQVKLKEEDRYVYELTLEFKLSHERIIIRN